MKDETERWYPLTVLLFAAGYLTYAVSKALFLVIALPLALLLAPFPRRRKRALQALIHYYLGFFTQRWLPFLGGYRIAEISGLDHARQLPRAAVIVANHRGRMDGLFMLGLVPRTGILIKASDTHRVTYIFLEKQLDLVGVERNSLQSLATAKERCRGLLNSGSNVLVFPEGTRAVSGRLQRFNRLAFDLAVAAHAPVLPVIIHSTCPFMARVPGSIFPRGRNVYRIRFLAPERPKPGEDPADLCERVHKRMARELKPLDAGTCWDTRVAPATLKTERASEGPENPATPLHEQQGTI
jgi:1-acyl-sn-glycerol-3-phosphate acyltransferase